MLNIFIGHRGTGKSHYLKQIQSFYKRNKLKALFFDLDEEIEKSEGKSISELFQKGERFFREREKEIFQKLISKIPKNKNCFLSVGAGFRFKKQVDWNVIFLCREGDKAGRVFLNRPRLIKKENPFAEYKKLYKRRQPCYLKQADEHLFRREHFLSLEDSDLLFLGLKKLSKPIFTLRLDPLYVPEDKTKLQMFLKKRLNWGLRFFELNDQTADSSFIQKIRSFVPEDKILFSSQCSRKFFSVKKKKNWSWDLSLGEPPKGVKILSLHHRKSKDLKKILKDFSSYRNYHLKLAVEIFNMEELKRAYDWFCEDVKNRSFLPRSQEGRWLWFRQAFGPQMFLHFIREPFDLGKRGKSFVPDQPFLSSAVPFLKRRKALAGILGDPVHLSATPAEQSQFFYKKYSSPVLALALKEEEMNKKSLSLFREMGFVFFAVTSPLKEKAFLSADAKDLLSQEFQTANTLVLHKKNWRAFNTDAIALKKLKKYSLKSTVVWGGGGIRPVLKKYLPQAIFYSARKAQPLDKKFKKKSFRPQTVIWAIGRKRMSEKGSFPPKHWKPSQVIDINYAEDSPGREYALKVLANYQEGWSYFKDQARKQREIFSQIQGLF